MRNSDDKGKSHMPAIAHPIFLAMGGGYIFGGVGYIFGGDYGAAVGAIVGAIAGVVSSLIIYKNLPELKLLCKIKIHLGTWVYDSDVGCSQTRICRRCGVHSSRVEHDVPDWESASSPWFFGPWGSEQSGVCIRCKELQVRKGWNQIEDWPTD